MRFLLHFLLVLSAFLCNALHAYGKKYWTILNKSQIAEKAFNGISKPNAFNIFKLNEVALHTVEGLNNFHINLPELASGIYIIKVGKEITKLTIQ